MGYGLVSRVHGFHEFFRDIMDDIIAFLGAHPGLRSHQPVALGQGHEHRIRIGSELERTFAEGRRKGQGRGYTISQ